MQSARSFHDNSGWSHVADRLGYYVVYPETSYRNQMQKCFNWYQAEDTRRDAGEALSIRNMIRHMAADYSIDAGHIYVTGVSGGAFMATALAASYPDVFAGAVSSSGGPAFCATTSGQINGCMRSRRQTPDQWRTRAIEENGYEEPPQIEWPKMIIWHGDDDPHVDIANVTETVEQWTALHGIDAEPDRTTTVGQSTVKTEYHDAGGQAQVVVFVTPGAGHGVQIDAANGCGDRAATYFPDVGACTASESMLVFGLSPGGPR